MLSHQKVAHPPNADRSKWHKDCSQSHQMDRTHKGLGFGIVSPIYVFLILQAHSWVQSWLLPASRRDAQILIYWLKESYIISINPSHQRRTHCTAGTRLYQHSFHYCPSPLKLSKGHCSLPPWKPQNAQTQSFPGTPFLPKDKWWYLHFINP